jgi:alpha-amylase
LQVAIRKAYNHLYAAVIDKKIAMKIGPASWAPSEDDMDIGQKNWVLLHSGPNFAVWEAVF